MVFAKLPLDKCIQDDALRHGFSSDQVYQSKYNTTQLQKAVEMKIE